MRNNAFESLEQLKEMALGVPFLPKTVVIHVTRVIPTRARENVLGNVFTAIGSISESDKSTVWVQFFDEWALGASFVEAGDKVILTNFAAIPTHESEDQRLLITPHGTGAVLRVHQEDENGTMEITVTPQSFESPAIRKVAYTETAFIY
ncbi:hypothetical protein AGDE_04538 [Angomonas deanei]|uniref:Uncharacterized protein n=1 Tax=Angomonas deanei TaxID=59799 RepID=A0A7G2CH80_9TRYP|nr:hypothetical protein AGDE_04538 [Angomonas deanei]CAD2218705.1 hypothetical protein, conserved [Angomonas deanei]|eukprot:EPY39390.1 hypothetical protein AGDE_04538 [Angomonas deanei]